MVLFALGSVLALTGCNRPADVTEEIVDNLVEAGFPSDDIMVVNERVYVGRDAEVSLAASREMLATSGTTEEQYRTNNVVSPTLTKICINGPAFTGVFGTALDMAIQNYDELPLTFAMARTPSANCSFTINALIDPNMNGGVAGFPANGLPFGQITIGGQLSQYGMDVIEHVITHEIGHTIGFRHSDYYNRTISCGVGGNEGDAGVGAIHIPGTPTAASSGGSIMNSCFRSFETGEFSPSDITALRTVYSLSPTNKWQSFEQVLSDGSGVHAYPAMTGDVNGDGRTDLIFIGQDWDGGGLNVRVKLSNGNGTWTAVSQVLGDGSGVHAYPAMTGDVNGDGRTDLIFIGQDWDGGGLNVRVKLSNGNGTWTAVSQVLGDGSGVHAYPAMTGDVNGDGRTDLIFIGQGWSGSGLNVRVKLSNGNGTWTAVSQVLGEDVGIHAYPAMTGDVNGDGRTDLIFIGQGWSGSGLNVRVKSSQM
jgi:hypothetical protein